jgi:hypothetical protein
LQGSRPLQIGHFIQLREARDELQILMRGIERWFTTGCALMSLSVITVLELGILVGVPF